MRCLQLYALQKGFHIFEVEIRQHKKVMDAFFYAQISAGEYVEEETFSARLSASISSSADDGDDGMNHSLVKTMQTYLSLPCSVE